MEFINTNKSYTNSDINVDVIVSNVYSRDQMESVIRTHIQNVAGHYKGQCYAWDVVNEALEENGQYRQSPMYRAMGADFIPFAFKVAAEVDPGAKLYYNDYNIEHPGAKATAALEIVKNIQAQGARIDGVGGQGHWIVGQTPSKQDLMSVLASYAALVDEVAYTEIDIRHSRVPASQSDRELQARDYVTVVDACLQTPKCIGITIWDFADQVSRLFLLGFLFFLPCVFFFLFSSSFRKQSGVSSMASNICCSTVGCPPLSMDKEKHASGITTSTRNRHTPVL